VHSSQIRPEDIHDINNRNTDESGAEYLYSEIHIDTYIQMTFKQVFVTLKL